MGLAIPKEAIGKGFKGCGLYNGAEGAQNIMKLIIGREL